MLSTSRQQNVVVIKITLWMNKKNTNLHVTKPNWTKNGHYLQRIFYWRPFFRVPLWTLQITKTQLDCSEQFNFCHATWCGLLQHRKTEDNTSTARELWRDVLDLKPQSMWSESHSPAARATPQWPKALTRCKPERWDLDYLKPQDRRRWALAESYSQGQLWTSSEQVLPKKATCHTFNLSCRSTPAVTGHRTAQ